MRDNTSQIDLKISVIIPVYNAEKYLEESVMSALQLPETAEVLLIEDGSEDGSLMLCKRLAENHPIVSLHQHLNGQNKGVSASRNMGIKLATAPYIAFMDADDFYLPNAFKIAKETFNAHPDALGVYGTHTVQYETESLQKNDNTKHIGIIYPIRPNVDPTELFEAIINEKWSFSILSLVLRRKAIAQNLSFNETLKAGEDTDFIFRLCFLGKLYPGSIITPIFTYRIHQRNSIHNKSLSKKHKFKNYSYWYNQIPLHNWKKTTNRRITLLMMDGKVVYKNKVVRLIVKTLYLIGLLLRKPAMIRKLL